MASEIGVFDRPQPKQGLFFAARERYVCYGGARGGGKSWCVQHKAILMAARYAGIRILILRRTLVELRENHIRPMRRLLRGVAEYKATDKTFEFPNGSLIVFGYCDGEGDVDQYQGQEYDAIFLDEATHFTEYQYATLTAALRGANDQPRRRRARMGQAAVYRPGLSRRRAAGGLCVHPREGDGQPHPHGEGSGIRPTAGQPAPRAA